MIRHSFIRTIFFSLASIFFFNSAGAWTDDPLQPNTPVKAAHIMELQAAVLAKEGACGMSGSPPFTPVQPGDAVSIGDVQTLRTRIANLYTAKNPPPPPMGNTLYPGGPVRAADITTLRSAIDGFDAATHCPPSACTSAADCNDGNVCTADACVSSACQHVNQPVDAVMSPWGACQADCTQTRTVVTPASCGGSTGALSQSCTGGACNTPLQNYGVNVTSPGGYGAINGICEVWGNDNGAWVIPQYVLQRDEPTRLDAIARGVTHVVVTVEMTTDNYTPCHRYLVADFQPGDLQAPAAFNDGYSIIDFTCGMASNACSALSGDALDNEVTVQEYF